MRVFEIETPDGRYIRHRHPDADTAKRLLAPGFKVIGEVLGSDAQMRGGLVDPLDGPSVMAILLQTRGHELLEWLRENGFQRAGKK